MIGSFLERCQHENRVFHLGHAETRNTEDLALKEDHKSQIHAQAHSGPKELAL